jgi:hypothetical protein
LSVSRIFAGEPHCQTRAKRAGKLSVHRQRGREWLAGRAGKAIGAFGRAGGADIDAGVRLYAAVTAMLPARPADACAALSAAAAAAHGHTDLVPESWLLAKAARLGSAEGTMPQVTGR